MALIRYIFTAALCAMGNADLVYKSRPDLAPPVLDITLPCTDGCEKGYLFVAPFSVKAGGPSAGLAQPGAYIIKDDGDLVWSGYSYLAGWNCNLQAARWKEQDVLFGFEGVHNPLHGHGHGHHTLLNNRYEVIKELRAGGHRLSDKHEFIILNETTALIQIYHPEHINLGAYGGDSRQSWIVNAIFQELDIESGDVLFEWRSLDHISPEETALPLPLGQAGIGHNSSSAWDYFHINSVTKGDDGHYLLSARHASTIYKINSTDGSIIWRLGGKYSNFRLGENVAFGFQHHARYLPGGNATVELISLFDNSVYGSESAGGKKNEVRLHPFSRGKYLALDHERKTATLVTAFHPPNNSILSKSQGSLQTLPNGNALINWGSEGQITEYTADGRAIFHAHFGNRNLDRGEQQNYRAFRFQWTGISAETIALHAESLENERGMVAYASWNGDTRTTSWRFVWQVNERTKSHKAMRFQKVIARTGFETMITIQDSNIRGIIDLSVEALDVQGRILARSSPVVIQETTWAGIAGAESDLGAQVNRKESIEEL